jgi:hypothetical protein
MKTVAFFLEKPSSRIFLEELIKANFKINPAEVNIRYSVYEGKQDLEKNLEKRIRGWNVPDTTFIVLRDQDSEVCEDIKRRLVERCKTTGKPETIIRIACHELESFFLGDLAALERALNIANISRQQNTRKYRKPDNLEKPSHEISILLSQRSKRKKSYLKIEGARKITPLLDPARNTSHSFGVLYQSLCKVFQPKADQPEFL